MDVLKDAAEAFTQRIRSPIVGSIIFAFVIMNWQPIWYLLFADRPVRQKFIFFDANTDFTSVYVPILSGIAMAIAMPWITYWGAWIAQVPIRRLRKLQSDEAHELELQKIEQDTQITAVRAGQEAVEEEAVISAAERVERAEEMSPKLAESILDKRDRSRLNQHAFLFPFAEDILKIASHSEKGEVRITGGEITVNRPKGGTVKIQLSTEIMELSQINSDVDELVSIEFLEEVKVEHEYSYFLTERGREALGWLDKQGTARLDVTPTWNITSVNNGDESWDGLRVSDKDTFQ